MEVENSDNDIFLSVYGGVVIAISAIAIQSIIVKPQSVQVDKNEALFIFKASQSLPEYPYDWVGVYA